MLVRGRKGLPESVLKHERFEVPKVRGHIQGNKTIINNFHQIAGTLSRPPEHLLKYVLKELASPGELSKTAMILGRKISSVMINEKITKYANELVLCSECGKPDTKLEKEGQTILMKCLACGARKPVKSSF